MKRLTLLGIPCLLVCFCLLLSQAGAQTLPPVNPVSNAPFCAGSNDLKLNETGGSAVSWQWFGPNGFTSSLKSPVIPNAGASASGLYTVTIKNAAGVYNVAAVSVVIHAPGNLNCSNHVQISLDPNGIAPVTPAMILQGNYPDYLFYSVSIVNAAGQNLGDTLNCSEIGQTLTVKVTDICNGNKCWGTLKVEDKLPPKIACKDFVVPCIISDFSPSYLNNTLGFGAAWPVASDNCVAFAFQYSDILHDLDCNQSFNGQQDMSGFVERKWTATDTHGNSAGCKQYIYLKRLHIPDLLLPPDVTVPCTNPKTDPVSTGAPKYIVNGVSFRLFPGTSWCELNTGYTDELVPVCDGSFKIVRRWIIFDGCVASSATPPYNPLEYQQLIKVMDNTGPKMVCPADLTVGTDPFQCCATIDLPDVTLTDDCSRLNNLKATIASQQPDSSYASITVVNGILTNFAGNNLWTSDTLGSLGLTPCLPVNNYFVTYRAEDDCANATICSFHLTVADQIPPVVACDSYTVVGLTSDGTAEVMATTFDDGSYDICCLDHIEARRRDFNCNGLADGFGPSVLFCCSDIGDTIMVIMRAWDCHGNSNDCMVTVVVQDKIKPVCQPPAHTTVSCENFDPSLGVYGKAIATDNCCMDTVKVSVNYSQFDTVCNFGTIVRTFRAFDCSGQSSQCTQRIVVFYRQDYYLKMPNDAIVKKCDGTGVFGKPSFYGINCELLGVSYEDQVYTLVPDACFKIERTWKIINWCTYKPDQPCIKVPNPNPSPNELDPNNIRGPVISPTGTLGTWTPTTVNLTPTSTMPTNYSTYYDTSANCYQYTQTIKVIDTQDPIVHVPASPVLYCDFTSNRADLWNESYWWDNVIGTHNLCEGPADLTISAIDSCVGTNLNIRFLLFLDLDGDGKMETVVNSTNLPAPGTVLYGNAADPNFLIGTPRTFDERNVPATEKYSFAIQTYVSGKLLYASIRWNTKANPQQYVVPELPYGVHKIKWIVEDGCSNETIKEYAFTVKDCKKPTAVCINGLSVNIMPTGMVNIWASDLLQYADDNCTPAAQIKTSIRKSGAGTGFPLDDSNNPVAGVTFTCADLGTQPVEIWVQDAAGNADFCETYVLIQDNSNNCLQVTGKVAGTLASESPNGLEQGNVEITGGSNAVPAFTYHTQSDPNGQFAFNAVPLSADFTLTPLKDDNPLNGITTYDLVLISKHILGLQPLSSPYKMIAADANKNGSITTLDIVELRKLILGIYQTLPNNTSWRFVDKSFNFPNPFNPFQTQFPENRIVSNYQGGLPTQDFVAIKVGDVNETAITGSAASVNDRSKGTLVFDVDGVDAPALDRIQSGAIFALHFKSAEKVQGYQFTLNLNGLEVLDMTPGENMHQDNFAVFPDAVTTSFDAATAPVTAEFVIRLRATQSGRLADMINLSGRITSAEGYAADGTVLMPVLHFPAISASAGPAFQLYQNQPNPFDQKTRIGFYLPEPEIAVLSVYDALGRVVFQQQKQFAKGENAVQLTRAQLGNESGILYYKVETPKHSATQKMVISADTDR